MKEDIRKKMINIRKDVSNKKEKSIIIMDKIITLDIYQKSSVIAIYNSMSSEVDTSKLISISLKNKIVLLPRIINNKIEFIRIDNNTKYNNSSFGVSEPIGNIYQGIIDLIIVPGVAFDSKGNRLGYGKGYYDKYLNNKDIYKIGVCFNEQVIDNLPIDKHDIKMNLIITDEKKYEC